MVYKYIIRISALRVFIRWFRKRQTAKLSRVNRNNCNLYRVSSYVNYDAAAIRLFREPAAFVYFTSYIRAQRRTRVYAYIPAQRRGIYELYTDRARFAARSDTVNFYSCFLLSCTVPTLNLDAFANNEKTTEFPSQVIRSTEQSTL